MSKQSNEYAAVITSYDSIPKSVLAAIAVSFASVGGERLDLADTGILLEWWMLYDAKVVTQKPNRARPNPIDYKTAFE